MYAQVQTGGKQYQIAPNDIFIVEKLEGKPGDTIEINEVLLIASGDGSFQIGSPYVKGSKIRAEIVRQTKGKKIHAFNYKAKKNNMKKWGHRQPETHLKVLEIVGGK